MQAGVLNTFYDAVYEAFHKLSVQNYPSLRIHNFVFFIAAGDVL